jgi:hypothetical protein
MRRTNSANEEAHRAREDAIRNELIAKEKARRERLKQDAEAKLQEARDTEARLYGEYDRVTRQLSNSRERLSEAKLNLAKASSDLERLGNRELELVCFNPSYAVTRISAEAVMVPNVPKRMKSWKFYENLRAS